MKNLSTNTRKTVQRITSSDPNALIIKEGTGEESDYTNAEVYMK